MLIVFMALHSLAVPPAGYYLVWGDEFSGSSLDPAKWWVWNQPDRSGYSTPDAVTVGGGYMTITTYTTNGSHYSGIVSSDGRFRARYGYSEASVEFNGSPGMFSDFWVNSANNGQFIGNPAASGAEVDVCEHRATDANDADNISGMVTIDLHWNGYGTSEKSGSSGLVGSGLGTGFHTYGFLWNNSAYNVSIDGVPSWNTNAGISDRTEIVLFSCEVDSNSFCGIVPPAGYGNFLVSTTTTVVDYFRFYAPTTTLYWTGASSANWNDTGNWLSNMIPASATDAVFSYLSVGNFDINLAQDTTVNSLSIQESGQINISGNPLTVNAGGIDMLSALDDAVISSPVIVGAAQTWNVASGLALIVDGSMSGTGALTLDGLGIVAMEGTNLCNGPTTISNGTLQVDGLITNEIILDGGTLDGVGTMAGPVLINSGTLGGTETITGPVSVNTAGTLTLGPAPDALTLSNTLTLQPGSAILLNINASTGTSDQILGLTAMAYGGTLIISNQAGALAAGESFNLFQAASYSGAFTRITPATPGTGLAWDTSALQTEGVLRVITTNSALMTAQWIGQQVALSWPATSTGWLLQSQTNPPGSGLTTNWITIPGSDATNSLTLSINPAAGSVFFRLVCPTYSTAIFGTGDLIVLRVGNGSIASTGAPGFLEDYSPLGGASVVQISLPTSGANALIFGGSSYDGVLSLSANGQSVVVGGYHIAEGAYTGTIDSSSTTGSTPVPRAVGLVNASGAFTLNAITTGFSGSTIRSAISDGSGNFWAGGGSSGILYLGSNSAAATVSSVSSSTRDVAFANGNICFTETGDGIGIMALAGAPKAAAPPALIINTAGLGSGTPSPKGFAINPSATIAYVADNRTASTGGGIQRFNWNGSAWVYAYTLGNTLTSSKAVEDLAVNFGGPNPILYTTTAESTGNALLTITDTGSNSAYTVLETAPSGDAFRGVTFAPAGQ
jgi:hypothetical protein